MPSLTTHFRTMQVTDVSLESPLEIEVSELVAPGQLLVSLPDAEAKRSETIRPRAGVNTRLTPDETGIIATCHGYPRIALDSTERGPTALITVLPLLAISGDLMEAQLTLYPPAPGAEAPTPRTLIDILGQAGVRYGVDTGVIEQALRQVAETGLPVVNCIAARGRAPLPGKDAMLRLEVEVGPRPGKLLANGTIDFRERMMFVAVAVNQILARKVPATAGIPGTNLAGEPIAARDGKDLQVKVSEGTAFKEEDGTIRATASGVLSLVGDDTLLVSSQQKIDGDVDFSTGNIRSHDAVHITGSILPAFVVSTRGDLLVDGNIQAATVNSHGNIVVKGGVLGPTSTVRVQGDADIHHIERSLLSAGGDIIIRASSYYSTVMAGGNIQCSGQVKLVGGEIIAGGSITVGHIGTTAADPIRIAVGIDPRRYRRYREMQTTYQEILTETQNWYNHHGRNKRSGRIEAMEEQLASLEHELNSFNLIPGTPEDSLGDRDSFYTEAQIIITGRISDRTIIRIGNERTTLKYELGKTRISMDRNSGAITFVSM